MVVLGGGPADEEEPLGEADLEEWGVGALAANPEEQASARPGTMAAGAVCCR